MERKTGAARLANAIAAPQWIVIAFLAVAAAIAGYGWSLVVLLTAAALVSMLLAAGVWRLFVRWWPRPGVVASMLLGLVLGAAAALLSFGAVSLDNEVSGRFGGSLLKDAAGSAVSSGVKAGANTFKTGTAVDVVTLPHRAVAGLAGGFLVAAALAVVFLGAVSLPVVTGLFGGLAAALRARRTWREATVDHEELTAPVVQPSKSI